MAKKNAAAPPPAKAIPSTKEPTNTTTTAAATTIKSPRTTKSTSTMKSTPPTLPARSSIREIVVHLWKGYINNTPSRTILLDIFLVFLLVIGALQFLYCILITNYPFNAFLSGFSAAVGQFVLTVSLRMQTRELPPNTTQVVDGMTGDIMDETDVRISSERAFADFVFGSLILHAFCINFIN